MNRRSFIGAILALGAAPVAALADVPWRKPIRSLWGCRRVAGTVLPLPVVMTAHEAKRVADSLTITLWADTREFETGMLRAQRIAQKLCGRVQ